MCSSTHSRDELTSSVHKSFYSVCSSQNLIWNRELYRWHHSWKPSKCLHVEYISSWEWAFNRWEPEHRTALLVQSLTPINATLLNVFICPEAPCNEQHSHGSYVYAFIYFSTRSTTLLGQLDLNPCFALRRVQLFLHRALPNFFSCIINDLLIRH